MNQFFYIPIEKQIGFSGSGRPYQQIIIFSIPGPGENIVLFLPALLQIVSISRNKLFYLDFRTLRRHKAQQQLPPGFRKFQKFEQACMHQFKIIVKGIMFKYPGIVTIKIVKRTLFLTQANDYLIITNRLNGTFQHTMLSSKKFIFYMRIQYTNISPAKINKFIPIGRPLKSDAGIFTVSIIFFDGKTAKFVKNILICQIRFVPQGR